MRNPLLAVFLAGCCAEPETPDINIDVTVLESADIDVPDRYLCTWYEWVEDRYFAKRLPYIGPAATLGDRVVITGRFSALAGQSEPCTDATCGMGHDGDTLVWHALELHRSDATWELGSLGRPVSVVTGQEESPDWCEWRHAIAVVTP